MPKACAGAPTPQVKYAWQHQADAVLSQVNPISGTWYTVLAATDDVRIISIDEVVTWAVTQPNPMGILITIDGVLIQFNTANPVSGQNYYGFLLPYQTDGGTNAATGGPADVYRAFMLEGHSVKVEVQVTWAVTQPTPLVCRVKWAKLLPT